MNRKQRTFVHLFMITMHACHVCSAVFWRQAHAIQHLSFVRIPIYVGYMKNVVAQRMYVVKCVCTYKISVVPYLLCAKLHNAVLVCKY